MEDESRAGIGRVAPAFESYTQLPDGYRIERRVCVRSAR